MPIKITCPHCGHAHRFASPYPLPGSEVQCTCGSVLVVSFPPDMMAKLEARGAIFTDTLDPDAGQRDSGPYLPAPTPARPNSVPGSPPHFPADSDIPGDRS